ncbi:MAG TPA: CDP-diacylglycerol--glycerol-3-phosphate 3-phosphatidyltransferase [Tissierellia bacterium]|nr:CDP-diacylglycerol--glycerol-3-phosphate 3-phosphatidyltransferase [Tissierellia bacterium]
MTIPNILTIIRIILVPLYLFVFYTLEENRILYSGIIYILAGLTDMLDGRIARKYGMVSKLGAALDPLADKLMTFAVLISFTSAQLISPWVLLIIGIKEILMILGGFIIYLFKEKRVLPSNKYGKIATASFYAAILSIVFKIPSATLVNLLILTTVTLNLLAFLNYFKIFMSKDRDSDYMR